MTKAGEFVAKDALYGLDAHLVISRFGRYMKSEVLHEVDNYRLIDPGEQTFPRSANEAYKSVRARADISQGLSSSDSKRPIVCSWTPAAPG